MREILFKAKRIDNGEWVEGNLVLTPNADEDFKAIIIPFNDNGEYTEGVGDKCLGFETWYKVDTTTLCQYTGLTDCNGNRIWEKDIIRLHDMTDEDYMVGWREDMTAFVLCDIKTHAETVDLIGDVVNEISYVEVIGNIFDNSELLDTTEN